MASRFDKYQPFCRVEYQVIEGKRRPVAQVICELCPETGFVTLQTHLPPDVVKKKLAAKGWRHEGRARWTCPKCVAEHIHHAKPPHRSPAVAEGSILATPDKSFKGTRKEMVIHAAETLFKRPNVPTVAGPDKHHAGRGAGRLAPDAGTVRDGPPQSSGADHLATGVPAPIQVARQAPRVPERVSPARPGPAKAPPAGAMAKALTDATLKPKVRKLLEEHFDERGFYLSGYSDERVAEETGAPIEMVRDIRKHGWGELRESPDIISLRKDIDLLRELIARSEASSQERLSAMEVELAKIRRSNEDYLRGLKSELDRLVSKLQDVG